MENNQKVWTDCGGARINHRKKIVNVIIGYGVLLLLIAAVTSIAVGYIRAPLTDMSVDASMSVIKGESTTTSAMAAQNAVSKVMSVFFWTGLGLFLITLYRLITRIIELAAPAKPSKAENK